MNIPPHSIVKIPEGILFRELEGESVILNTESEVYFGLDEVGTRIWVLLAEYRSVEKVYQQMIAEYDVEPEKLRQDLICLMEKLEQNGLIEIDHG